MPGTYTEYRDEINYIFSHYTRRGFVDYRACRDLELDMTRLLEEATRILSKRRQYKELFDLTNKAFLKWDKTSKDDSDGETQNFECYVIQAWDAVYDADFPDMPHTKFDYEIFCKDLEVFTNSNL